MNLQEADVENWDSFLKPIFVKNINNISYQCNNSIILCPITNKMFRAYESKQKDEFIIIMDRTIAKYNIDLVNDDYFVKISSISGKDIVYDYDEESTTDNENFWKETNTNVKKLIMKNVQQLCDYLFNSERINEWFSKNKYIVFRKWIDYKVEEEFRCFIHNKKLVAISQYDYGEDLPNNMKKPGLIKDLVHNFINQVIGLIPFNNIVIDLAVCLDSLKVYFIEFNSFGLCSDTDAGLYDWVHDANILTPERSINVDIRLFDVKYIERKYSI